MKERLDTSYFAYGNRNFNCLYEYPNLYKSTSSVKSTASNLMQRNYLDFDPEIINHNSRNRDNKLSRGGSEKDFIFYRYHPEYKLYHETNGQNKILNNYLNPVNQYTYRDNPIIQSAEQLLCIQKRKKNMDSSNSEIYQMNKMNLDNFSSSNATKTEPNYTIQLKNPLNQNILVSNDFHLGCSTNAERRIKPPNRSPNMAEAKFGSFLESKGSPEYLRNYDKESLRNIDNYYINKKENIHVLSRFGNWITLKPDDKNRSHALEKLKHGVFETSIVAPDWMDIASRRQNNIKDEEQSKDINNDYNFNEFNNKMFKSVQHNNNCRDKTRVTILMDRDQKNVKPVFLRDSYDKNRILINQKEKDSGELS